MEEEDPKEDHEEYPEEDPEGDSEASEGQLMSSEDLGGDQRDEEGNHPAQDEYSSNSEDLRANKAGITRWERGRCGRMCRGTCPLVAPSQ